MTSERQRTGDAAEGLAAKFLERKGLAIVERNWRCRGGEVRLRGSAAFGGARASIDAHKQRRILLAARLYLAAHPDTAGRCDVVLLDRLDTTRIEWLRDAFGE